MELWKSKKVFLKIETTACIERNTVYYFLKFQRNDSADYDGTFGMWTGASDIMKVGQISEWNYMKHVNENIYPNSCGELTGSAGEFFPPGRGKDHVDFFTPDLCRFVHQYPTFLSSLW